MTTLTIFLYDGQRRPFSRGNALLHVRKLDKNLVSQFVDKPVVEVHFESDPGPVTIIASCSDHRQCGIFASGVSRPVHLMLMHKSESIDFDRDLPKAFLTDGTRSAFEAFIASDPESQQRLTSLQATDPKALACLMNVLEAIRWLPNAKSVIQTLEAIDLRSRDSIDPTSQVWKGLQQDRVFAVAKKTLVDLLDDPPFPFKGAPSGLHPPADKGFKEVGRFGEANLNFSLVTKDIPPEGKVFADIDLDYFDDTFAHLALEVIPNEASKLTGKRKRTNPAQIYAFRWMNTKNFIGRMFLDGQELPADPDKRPDYNPLFTVSPG